MSVTDREPLLRVDDLVVEYPGRGLRRPPFRALHEVSIQVARGETLGIVGESGSGKTTLGRAILGLAPVTSGRVAFDGRDISHLAKHDRRALSSDIQVVFQDPYSSLNPAMTVFEILTEPLRVAGISSADARRRVQTLLDQVHLPSDAGDRYPNEFSGGQRQRVAIARALSREPRLVVCDEPVSGLDLSNQATVLDLFMEIQNRTGVAYLFVTHDISLVRHISHRVVVMNQGRTVEEGTARQVTTDPRDPYTQRLMLAAPVPDPERQAARREQFRAIDAA
ncbi:ATP-binding cassette domain-containing protein [Microbacterium sp. X-17]|uniref:ABC transporter ATP-binding protein n=1 Tax=Microbacterium sp. X-17 TaxID=3144404 RepID=UPI0031F57833